jgi:twitching motility protein PilT
VDAKELLRHFKSGTWTSQEEVELFLYSLDESSIDGRVLAQILDVLCAPRSANLQGHKLRCQVFGQLAARYGSADLFPAYVRALKRGDHHVRAVIVPLVETHGGGANATALCELLGAKEPELRKVAAQALQSVGSVALIPALERLVRSRGFDGRGEALDVAWSVAQARALPVLQAALDSGDARERAKALRMLGDAQTIGRMSGRALELIKQSLADPDQRVVCQAIGSFGNLCGEQEYFEYLAPYLQAGDTELVRAAVRGLHRFDSHAAINALSRKLHSGPNVVRLDVLDTLEKIADDVVLAPLVEALAHTDAAIRKRAGDVLGNLSRSGALDTSRVIIWLLRSDNVNVRRMAVEVARTVKDPNAELWPRLFDHLCDEDWWVRERVKDSLVAMAGTQLTPFMGRFMQHRQKVLRRFGVDVLAQLRDKRALGALVKTAQEDQDWWTRERAIEALGTLEDERALPYIIDLMSRDEEVEIPCIQALVQLNARPAAPHIARLLGSGDADVRQTALQALDTLQAIEFAEHVKPLLSDPEPRVARKAKEVLLHWNVALAGDQGASLKKAISLLDRMLIEMSESGADDLIIAADRRPFVKRMGKTVPLSEVPLSTQEVAGLLTPHLSVAQLEDLEALRDVDLSYEVKHAGLRFRVNVFQQRCGLSAVFRVIKGALPSLETLGLPPVVAGLGNLRHGLVLVGGPTGSGKSTTLAALIDNINSTSSRHVLSLEDPIEVVHPSKQSVINQRELGTHTASFNSALKSTLRQDPDVILVGEMRDLDTISFAITAADTGHLVFGTVHTSSADTSVDRLISAFPVNSQEQIRYTLSESLRAVVCQFLIKRADTSGRALACEVMLNNDAVANMIRKGKTHQIASIIATSREEGMQLMDSELLRLYHAGHISYEEAHLRAIDKKALEEQTQDATATKGGGQPEPSARERATA